MSFASASIWIKVAFFCLLLGTLLFVIGFATVSWMVHEPYRTLSSWSYGLWKWRDCGPHRCTSQSITSRQLRGSGWEDWYRATQAMECIGLVCLGMALLICTILLFIDRMRRRTPILAVIFFSFAAVVFTVIGYVIFGTKLEGYDVGWSMGVACTGTVLAFVAGVMTVISLQN